MNNNDKNWWQNMNNSPKPNFNKKAVVGICIVAAVFVLAGLLLSTMVYTVNDKQEAVITTFGKVTEVTGPGMHLKIPFGIQKAQTVDVNIYQKIEIGYRTNPDGSTVSVDEESKMISGDYNIVNVDFFVEYRITDPVKYLYNSVEPDRILKNLAQSEIRNVIGSYDVDKILTTGKNEIQEKIKSNISADLAQYDIGLSLTDVKIQDSEPPTQEVMEAFKEVETAKQDKETAVNVAKAYENSKLPEAQAQADKLVQNAEFLKQDRINEAKREVAMFTAIYNEYILNPSITKRRMYYEALEKVLPGAKVYIDVSDSSTQKLLPLEDFAAK